MDEMPFDVPGGWSQRIIALCGRRFEILLPADPDRVLEAQLETERDEQTVDTTTHDPYWAALWSSARPTAEVVLESAWQGDERVLEIGCGMGLVGLAALARGLRVTFSDHVSEAVEVALKNARRNGFPEAQGLQLDWEHPPAREPADRYSVILASDILYNRANHEPILTLLDQLLATDGVCWIGDPGRFNSREFLHAACQRFRVQLRDREGNFFSVPHSGQFQMFVLQR